MRYFFILSGALLGLGLNCSAQQDHRQGALKDLNGDFAFTPPATREGWEARAARVRLQVKVALGMHPMPPRTPLHAVRHGRRAMDGYALEKVMLEARPGFFVTGNLYLPLDVSGPVPGVLSPHGHWPDGRFMRAADAEVARQMASGAEREEAAARSPLQARCVHLARMGCVVFHYDMIGYADSVQLPLALAHQYKAQRPDMDTAEGWGFFSAAAEGRLQSIMALQVWSGVRALDFLTSLPEVDAARIGVTGASGGATQTFLLAAVDPRPAVIFPAVMVSTAMQGGCTCENASLLRVGTGNVELAALFAPKPAGYTAADDWTKEFSTKGFPQLHSVYQLTEAPENVSLLNRTEFPHNYNLPSRLAMYQWMARHLKTPRPALEQESPFVLQEKADLTVWDAAHPAPVAGDPTFEKRLLQNWSAEADRQIAAQPHAIEEALPILLGRTWQEAAAGPFEWKPNPDPKRAGAVQQIAGTLTLGRPAEQVRCVFLYPDNWSGRVLVRLTDMEPDKAQDDEKTRGALAEGTAVAFPALFQEIGAAPGQFRRLAKDRDFVGYTAGYNTLPLARRAHDLMGLLAWMQQHDPKPSSIHVDAAAALVPETVLALAMVPKGTLDGITLEESTFRFAKLTDPFDVRLLPGMVKYGDLPALLERVRERYGPRK